MDKGIQCAYLCVQELCQESLAGTDQKYNAEEVSHHIAMDSMDLVQFKSPVHVGDILEFRGHIVFVDVKSGRVRVRVVSETISPQTGKSTQPDEDKSNVFHLTYKVSGLKMKQVLPRTYRQSLLFLQGMRVLQS